MMEILYYVLINIVYIGTYSAVAYYIPLCLYGTMVYIKWVSSLTSVSKIYMGKICIRTYNITFKYETGNHLIENHMQ